MRKKLFAVLVFVYLGISGGYAQWNINSMLRMGRDAIIYFDDYVSAIENFNNIIRIKPYLSEPYFSGGWQS